MSHSAPTSPASESERASPKESVLYRDQAICHPRKLARRNTVLRHLPALADRDACADIGAGYGGLIAHFCRRGRWAFVEPDGSRLAIARRHLEGTFHETDADTFLHQHSGDLSLVTIFDTIAYCPDPKRTLELVARGLKPGGRLLLTTVNDRADNVLFRLRSRLGIGEKNGELGPAHMSLVRGWLQEAGLKIEEEEHFGGPLALFLQTILDVVLLVGKQGGDLTVSPPKDVRHYWPKRIAFSVMKTVSQMINFADDRIPRASRSGVLLVVRKP